MQTHVDDVATRVTLSARYGQTIKREICLHVMPQGKLKRLVKDYVANAGANLRLDILHSVLEGVVLCNVRC